MDAPDQRLRRVEEASLNAWPALHQVLVDGWVVRLAGGFTRRANSATPLYPGQDAIAGTVDRIEDIYRRAGLRPLIRLTDLTTAPSIDTELDRRGYDRGSATDVLWRTLDDAPGLGEPNLGEPNLGEPNLGEPNLGEPNLGAPNLGEPNLGQPNLGAPNLGAPNLGQPATELLERDAWLDHYSVLAEQPPEATALHRLVLASIQGGCLHAVLRDADGSVVACGLGVPDGELLGLFDLVTERTRRRSGHARRLVTELLRHGRRLGANAAYLQVVTDNEPARRLYAQLGFEPLYRYRYRAGPATDAAAGHHGEHR